MGREAFNKVAVEHGRCRDASTVLRDARGLERRAMIPDEYNREYGRLFLEVDADAGKA